MLSNLLQLQKHLCNNLQYSLCINNNYIMNGPHLHFLVFLFGQLLEQPLNVLFYATVFEHYNSMYTSNKFSWGQPEVNVGGSFSASS